MQPAGLSSFSSQCLVALWLQRRQQGFILFERWSRDMLKACPYCGRIHAFSERCSRKPQRAPHRDKQIESFRNSKAWQNTREAVLNRDLHLCQACLHKLPGTVMQYNSANLSVHHIAKVESNWKERFETDNLITLCRLHHVMADDGRLLASALKRIVKK